MICKYCGEKMTLNDTDYNFKGNYDSYWECEKCKTSCVEEVRFGQRFKEKWLDEDDIKYCEIKHKIKRK